MQMKVDAIKLVGFQAHRRFSLRFDQNIVTICGATDAGKSAILRALRWICLNGMGGEQFIHRDGKQAKVAILVSSEGSESVTIGRIKGDRENIYKLGSQDFRSFGQDVPDAIKRILNLSELNFQEQHDSPFWLSETAGEVSRQLNSVIDLSIIDDALSNIAKRMRTAVERRSLVEERLAEAKREVEKLEPQRARIEEFEILRDLQTKARKSSDGCTELNDIVERVRRTNASQLKERAADLEEVFDKAKRGRTLAAQAASLRELIEDAETFKARSVAPPDFSSVQELWTEGNKVSNRFCYLESSMKEIESAQQRVNAMKDNLLEAEEQLHKQTKGQTCPLCGSKIQ